MEGELKRKPAYAVFILTQNRLTRQITGPDTNHTWRGPTIHPPDLK
jgi:hypothetical protein